MSTLQYTSLYLTFPSTLVSTDGYKIWLIAYTIGDGNGKDVVVMHAEFDNLLQWAIRTKDHHTVNQWEPTVQLGTRSEREMNVASGCPQFAIYTALLIL
jgi:hypothetical protein